MNNKTMSNKKRVPRRLILLSLFCAVLQLHVGLPHVAAIPAPVTPEAASGRDDGNAPAAGDKAGSKVLYGRLAINGDKLITVNGNTVRSGATIINGAQLATPAAVGASVQLWPLGRLEIMPQTTLQLSFSAGRINVDLLAGCVVLMTYAGTRGEIKTPQGTMERSGPNARDFIDVCTGEPGAAAPIVGQGAATRSGLERFNALFLFGAAPAGVLAGVYAGRCHGKPPVASPCGGCCCCC